MNATSVITYNKLFTIPKIVFILLFMFTFNLLSISLFAQAKVKGDPMVKITSLPIEQQTNKILPLISEEVSNKTGLDEAFITYYWQFFEDIYCPGVKEKGYKCPIFVDLYIPAFMSKEEIQTVMKSIAGALEKYTDYSMEEVFIHTHIAEKYQIYIMGDVVTNWSQIGGPDDAE